MTENQLFDHPFWMNIAAKLPDLSDDLEGVEHLVYRFVDQYLPVLLRVTRQEDIDHAWLAFWSYLVAPRTHRKPCYLSSWTADLLIAEFQSVLSERS
ncbi:MAG: hypothetical protein BZY75_06255 [SAR202 cluster bacterium Io17-Chloro-G7]|nr:MAG: hypothetical protein BZY75_06255 [SAR202 cluster bacterium Io17-Chloro-G7]